MNNNFAFLAVLLLLFTACEMNELNETGPIDSTTEEPPAAPTLDGLIEYSINGGELNILNKAWARIVDNEVLHIFSYDSDSDLAFDVQADFLGSGSATPYMTIIQGLDSDNNFLRTKCGSQHRRLNSICSDLDFTIISMGQVGGEIQGTLTGSTYGLYPDHEEAVSIDARFKVVLAESLISNSVEGKVWLDENENGIQDPGEIPLSGRALIAKTRRLWNTGHYPRLETGITEADGTYVLDGLVPGELYNITYTTDSYKVTQPNLGSDERDSDFEHWSSYPSTPQIDEYRFQIESFPESGSITDVDLGLIVDRFHCNFNSESCGPDVYIVVSVSGGVEPYVVTLDGVETSLVDTRKLVNVSPGEHEVTVRDQTGFNCERTVRVREFVNTLRIGVWLDEPAGTPNVQDENEYGLNSDVGAVYTLLDENGAELESEEAGPNNSLWFQFLESGTYQVGVQAPPGYKLVDQVVGGPEDITSEVDPATGISKVFIFNGCDEVQFLKIGLRKE